MKKRSGKVGQPNMLTVVWRWLRKKAGIEFPVLAFSVGEKQQ